MPSEIEPDPLIKLLADRRFLLSFFNDIEGEEESPWYPAIQYMGTKGFFTDYYARPADGLTKDLALLWAERTAGLLGQSPETPMEFAQRLQRVGSGGGQGIKVGEFMAQLSHSLRSIGQDNEELDKLLEQMSILPDRPITRGQACQVLFEVLKYD